MFERSGAGFGKRLGADSGKWAVLSHASWRVSQRKERGVLFSKGRTLGKDDEPGTPQGVPVTGKCEAWLSDTQLVRYEGVRWTNTCMGRLSNNSGGRTSGRVGER